MNEVENPCRMLAENHGHLNYPPLCVISSALEKKTVELVQTEGLGGTANSSQTHQVPSLIGFCFWFLFSFVFWLCVPQKEKFSGFFKTFLLQCPLLLGSRTEPEYGAPLSTEVQSRSLILNPLPVVMLP